VNVLVVDDSLVMRRMLTRVLRATDLPIQEMYEACDGLEALALLNEHPVDFVLTDINMPNMGGLEFLGVVRQNPAWKSVQVVIVTTDGGERRVLEALRLGAADYLRKPFTPDQIKGKLSALVDAGASEAGLTPAA
jgi:two-component system chemotaxis response regulator CheY